MRRVGRGMSHVGARLRFGGNSPVKALNARSGAGYVTFWGKAEIWGWGQLPMPQRRTVPGCIVLKYIFGTDVLTNVIGNQM